MGAAATKASTPLRPPRVDPERPSAPSCVPEGSQPSPHTPFLPLTGGIHEDLYLEGYDVPKTPNHKTLTFKQGEKSSEQQTH